MQIYHSKCSLRVRILIKLGLIKGIPRFRVIREAPALGSISYRCDRCGTELHVDTDWEDEDLKADFVVNTAAYPVEVFETQGRQDGGVATESVGADEINTGPLAGLEPALTTN